MSQDDTFSLSFDRDFDSYDPLADYGLDIDEYDEEAPAESGVIPLGETEFPSMEDLAKSTEMTRALPASARIENLFDGMQPARNILIAILDFCMEPRTNDDCVALITDMKKNKHIIYTPDNLLSMLERAGALDRITEDGESYDVGSMEPETVVIDGVEYLEPTTPPDIFWFTTEDGGQVVLDNRPMDRIESLFADDTQFLGEYRIVLEGSAREEGITNKELLVLIDQVPENKKNRIFSARFSDHLKKAEAIEWRDKAWHITSFGLEALGLLDQLQADQTEAAAETIAESTEEE